MWHAVSAYYNEHDPKAAAWLRELITEGLIADGEVDTRSITDVQPDELKGFVQCHFFAGIGGWSYALRLAGWDDDRPVWTGSCPCQPFSAAGAQAGGDDPRHLWPAWFRLIKECQPHTVFGEQVESAVAHGWLDLVCDDLEGEGYAVGAVGLPACSVGAPHIRQRLWFVAESSGTRAGRDTGAAFSAEACGPSSWGADGERCRDTPQSIGATGKLADTQQQRARGDSRAMGRTKYAATSSKPEARGEAIHAKHGGPTGKLADAEHPQRRPLHDDREDGRDGAHSGRGEAHGEPGTCGEVHLLAHPQSGGQREHGGVPGDTGHLDERDTVEQLGDTNIPGRQARHNESVRAATRTGEPSQPSAYEQLGHPSAARLQGRNVEDVSGARGRDEGGELASANPEQLGHAEGERDANRRQRSGGGESNNASPWRDLLWLPCRDGKARPTQPGLQPLAHGVSARVGLLRGYGNAIVPQVAAEVIAAYMTKRTNTTGGGSS